jgi:hypothetical protein
MKNTHTEELRIRLRPIQALALTMVLWVAPPAFGQSAWYSSFGTPVALQGFSQYLGEWVAAERIGATFRSEFGTSFAATQLQGAKLTGSSTGELDLKAHMPINGAPHRYQVGGNLRLWRLGFRYEYSHFENESHVKNLGEFDFSGSRLGLDLDVIHRKNYTLGFAVDKFFAEPKLHGYFQTLYFPPNPATGAQDGTLNLTGGSPTTLGAYLRLTPTAILGYPLHIEAYYKGTPKNAPLNSETRYLTYGFDLVFRPQIYRFDLAWKIGLGKTHIKFAVRPDLSSVPTEKWEVDMDFDEFNFALAAYF